MASTQAEEITIFDYVRMLWRQKWRVLTLCVLGVAVALAISLQMTKIYASTATLISPKETVNAGGLLGGAMGGLLSQAAAAASISSLSVTPNRDLLLSVLKSRRVARSVVDQFGLQERFGVRYPEDAVRILRDERSSVSASVRESTISVSVEDPDPALAAQMANYFIEQAGRVLNEFDSQGAGRERTFLTEQLAQAKADLARAETAVQRFQEQNRTVVLQDETRGAIVSAAQLKGEVMAAEVQLQVMRSFATEANPEVVALRRKIQAMNRQLAQMQFGDGTPRRAGENGGRPDFSRPLAQVPEMGVELARLTRELTVRDTLVGLLVQQLERTKIAEAHDTPVVTVLDPAAPARRPSKPKLYLNLALGLISGFMLAAAWAFWTEYLLPPRRRKPA